LANYSFVTVWHADAPVERVWDAIYHPLRWPEWWKGVVGTQELEPGDDAGVGAVHRYTWKSALPYKLEFDMRVTKVEPNVLLEGEAFGELEGTGVWTFTPTEHGTTVRYNWDIRTTRPWMNALAPLLKPAFEWNHDWVMNSGGRGLAALLGANVEIEEHESPGLRKPAIVAGLVAGAGALVIWRRRARPRPATPASE
jgi:uncharacterized protein YndB with AHSA1/START domain